MKTTFKIAFIIIFMVSAGRIYAQPGPPNMEDMAKQETEWMKKELSLTPKQLAVVDSLNKATAKLRQKAFEDSQGDFESVRPAMEKIDAEVLPKFKTILTKQQYDLYVEKQKARMARRGPGGPGGPGEPDDDNGPQ